jgi:hypothetical protein
MFLFLFFFLKKKAKQKGLRMKPSKAGERERGCGHKIQIKEKRDLLWARFKGLFAKG